MKTGEVAKMMGVSSTTIANWTDQPELTEFFSIPARASDPGSAQRDYSSDDILVLNTIRLVKTRNNSWRDVAAILLTGHREDELPISATLTKSISPADQVVQLMRITNERDSARAQLKDAQEEITRLRKELESERGKTPELYKEIGRLEHTVQMLEDELKKNGRQK